MGAASLGTRPRQHPQPLSRIQRREQCVERRAPGRVPGPESLAISAMRVMMTDITAGLVTNAALHLHWQQWSTSLPMVVRIIKRELKHLQVLHLNYSVYYVALHIPKRVPFWQC